MRRGGARRLRSPFGRASAAVGAPGADRTSTWPRLWGGRSPCGKRYFRTG
ncbi:hypothetical protein BURMUCF2_A0025 [Burkholderia multivorans CF2]|nr:hypothetical protein BURMUCF2_A0025 [Burkholderia multivorans CF2]